MKKRNLIILFAIIALPLFAMPGVEVFFNTGDDIPGSPVVGDIDLDGDPEIVITTVKEDGSSGYVTAVRVSGLGAVDTLWHVRCGRNCFDPAIGDVDGDGVPEVVLDVYFDLPGGVGVVCLDGVTGSVEWALDVGGELYNNAGHQVLLADYDTDGEIEVISQQNSGGYMNEIVVIDGATGIEEFRMNTGAKRSYASMYCGDINYDGRNELVASVTGGSSGDVEIVVWNDVGTELWRALGGPPAIADIDLDGQPEIVCGWVEGSGSYDYHLFAYSADGTLEDSLITINSTSTAYQHYECPVIANFDISTPEPEIAFAVNHTPTGSQCIVTVIHSDGTIFWQTPPFDNGEIISMSAADLSCDGAPDLCSYNMAGEFIVFDGRSGYFWATFDDFEGDYAPEPSRWVAIADVDNDCHAEFVVSTYRGGYSATSRGIYIYGDDDDWTCIRRLWNTGSYYYENVDDHLGLLSADVSNRHWEENNMWRTQWPIPHHLVVEPEFEPIECAGCDSIGYFEFSALVSLFNRMEIAYYSRVTIDFGDLADSCLTMISGEWSTYIGDIMSETDTLLHWTFAVSPLCDSTEISFWIHATCLNSLLVPNEHIQISVTTPNCHVPPIAQLVHPTYSGQVIACGPSDTASAGWEIIYNIASDSLGLSEFTLEWSDLGIQVRVDDGPTDSFDLTDPEFSYTGDSISGNAIYDPPIAFSHGDTVHFQLLNLANSLGCETIVDECWFAIDDVPPETVAVHPIDGGTYTLADPGVYAVLRDDFVGIDTASVNPCRITVFINDSVSSGHTIRYHSGASLDTLWIRDIPADSGDVVEVCLAGMFDLADPTYCGHNIADTICWSFTALAFTSIKESSLPTEFSMTIEPNPFNSAVRISVSAGVGASDARPGQFGIEIFDIAGRLVAELPVPTCDFENPQVGPTPVIWQPDETVGSGVYLVRAKIGDEDITKRIIYLK